MKNYRNLLFPAGTLTLFILFYTITMLPQDRIFSEYKQVFHELQHPPGTRFIASYNAFGALDKIRVMYKDDFRQGCDYRVGEIREYSGSEESIEAFYAVQTFEIRGESTSPGVLFIPMNEAEVIDPYGLQDEELAARGPAAFDVLENLKHDQSFLGLKPPASYYYVAIWGFSLSDHDMRCLF